MHPQIVRSGVENLRAASSHIESDSLAKLRLTLMELQNLAEIKQLIVKNHTNQRPYIVYVDDKDRMKL